MQAQQSFNCISVSIRNINTLVPAFVRQWWWYCSDAQWRKEYRAVQARLSQVKAEQRRAVDMLWGPSGGMVVSGPFRGMKYLGPEQGGSFPQKLLGTYEKELWPIVERIVEGGYDLVVDAGAAEGFYVCGLARRMSSVSVIAFEAQEKVSRLIGKLAQLNEVEGRVEVRGYCDAEELGKALSGQGRKLMICDIEGGEMELLDPRSVPDLSTCDVLVEVHEHLRPGVREALRTRFGRSHNIEPIKAVSRTIADLPEGIKLEESLALSAMNESRGNNVEWFWMTCKH